MCFIENASNCFLPVVLIKIFSLDSDVFLTLLIIQWHISYLPLTFKDNKSLNCLRATHQYSTKHEGTAKSISKRWKVRITDMGNIIDPLVAFCCYLPFGLVLSLWHIPHFHSQREITDMSIFSNIDKNLFDK